MKGRRRRSGAAQSQSTLDGAAEGPRQWQEWWIKESKPEPRRTPTTPDKKRIETSKVIVAIDVAR
ncbi:hypothetical protein PG990_014933 [Apiospora arundinis]